MTGCGVYRVSRLIPSLIGRIWILSSVDIQLNWNIVMVLMPHASGIRESYGVGWAYDRSIGVFRRNVAMLLVRHDDLILRETVRNRSNDRRDSQPDSSGSKRLTALEGVET